LQWFCNIVCIGLVSVLMENTAETCYRLCKGIHGVERLTPTPHLYYSGRSYHHSYHNTSSATLFTFSLQQRQRIQTCKGPNDWQHTMAPFPGIRSPSFETLRNWQPFRLQALGLITLLGADEISKATGSLTQNVLTEYLPLLGAYQIASNQIAQVEPGFALYNITDGVWITEIQAWFTRWLWMNIEANYVTLKWTHCKQPRQKCPRHVWSLLIGMVINFGLIALTTLRKDWYGVATTAAMFVSVLVRAYVRDVMLARVDKSFSKGEKIIQDPCEDPSLAKFIIVFPDGKLAIFRCERSYLRVMIDDKKPMRLFSRFMLRVARGFGWLAFAVQIVAIGQASLSTQIVTVFVMVLASLLTVYHIGERCPGRIGSFIQIEQQEVEAKRRLDVYAKLLPTSEEERYMTRRGLFPDKRSAWGADWWVRWHEAKTRATETDLFLEHLKIDLFAPLFVERLKLDLSTTLDATKVGQQTIQILSSVLPDLIRAFAGMSTRGSTTRLSKLFLISIYDSPM
jgi:hypothetical protein